LEDIVVRPDASYREFLESATLPFKPFRSPWVAVLKFAGGVLGAGMVIAIIETWGSFAGAATIAAAIAFVLYFVALYATNQQAANSRLRTCFESGKKDPASYVFSNAGISAACDCTKSEISWAAIDRLVETEGAYVLILRSLACLCIPKRDVPAGRAVEFAALLRAKL